jgi:hypothetical protein
MLGTRGGFVRWGLCPPRSPKARDRYPTDEDLLVGTPDHGPPTFVRI